MAYHEISIMDVWEVIRRWHSGAGIRAITRSLGYDRKTVQRYTRLATSHGLSREKPLPPRAQVLELLGSTEACRGRSAEAQSLLEPYLDEITSLVHDPDNAIKPKTAFLVLLERHGLAGKISYTSFKRFVRSHRVALSSSCAKSTCRDLPPVGD